MSDRECGVRTAEALRCHADAVLSLSTRNNRVANNDEECSVPVEVVGPIFPLRGVLSGGD